VFVVVNKCGRSRTRWDSVGGDGSKVIPPHEAPCVPIITPWTKSERNDVIETVVMFLV
jgi:hypothetical protein